MRVLVIEDNTRDVELLQAVFGAGDDYQLHCTSTLEEAIQVANSQSFDVVLMDLHLSDSSGLDTFLRFKENAPDYAVVIHSANTDKDLAFEAMEQGAEDFLFKGNIQNHRIEKTLRYAVQRHAVAHSVSSGPFVLLDELKSKTSATAGVFSIGALRDHYPTVFANCVLKVKQLMDLSLDQRQFRVEHHLANRIEIMINELGAYRASPEDIVAIYRAALDARLNQESVAARQAAFRQEGQLILVGMLAKLASYYRSEHSISRRESPKDRGAS